MQPILFQDLQSFLRVETDDLLNELKLAGLVQPVQDGEQLLRLINDEFFLHGVLIHKRTGTKPGDEPHCKEDDYKKR